MAFHLNLSTDNAAFEEDQGRPEIARILRELANRLEQGSEETGKLYDANGNAVGRWTLTPS